MVFCGSCGKQADNSDRFCTVCGSQIKEVTISVAEELGQVIKEEYRESTVPPDANLSKGTHIGDQKRAGEWLEFTTDNILKFAGYQTIRQYAVQINPETKDKFYVDVLASDPYVDIFVECKDYKETKLPEKILFEFIGQLNHYRKLQTKQVIGILAMTARDDSSNKGIREKLRTENAYLWDGSFIEHLQNKMTEVKTKEEFHSYIVNHLSINEHVEQKTDGTTLIARIAFYTVQKHEYIGKKFDVMNIIDEIKIAIKKECSTNNINEYTIIIPNYEIESIKDNDGNLIRYLIHMDFSVTVSQNDIDYYETNKSWINKIRRKHAATIAHEEFVKSLMRLPQVIYGINYNPKGKDNFAKIYYEGGRIA